MTQEQKLFIEKLYKENYTMLYAYGLSMLRDRALTENMINDTFLVAIRKIHRLLTHQDPAAWLRIALKININHYRYTRSLAPKIVPIDEVKDEQQSYKEELCFWDLEDALTEEECAFFQAYYDLGCSHKELGERFNISVSASQKRLERIRKKLKETL